MARGSGKKTNKMKTAGKTKKSNLADMSVEELMAADFDSEDEPVENGEKDEEENEDGKSQKNHEKSSSIGKHKQSLEKLKDTDPEFYEFLQENEGGLLDFNESDESELESDDEEDEGTDDDVDDDEEEEEEDDDSDDEELETSKQAELESDEEDYVDEDDEGKKRKGRAGISVSLALVDKWRQQLEGHSVKAMRELMKAFRAAVQQAGSGENVRTKYIVEGSAAFNAVVSLCLKQVYPVLQHALEIEDKAGKAPKAPSSSPKWKQFHVDIKAYLADVIQLMSNVAEPSIVSVVLRHVRSLIPYFTCFPKLVKVIIKKLVNFWSTGEETVRVLAFLCLFSIIRCTKESRLDFILKQMYLAYVRNTKFTSPSTLPVINFMQRSLTEMFALNTQVTYQHAFVYIRQLAIHLRNAITVKKKDMYQSVYNWQYIHCVYLWCRVLATLHSDETLKPLVYPLVQTSVGVIKLIPAARYYPLRFHVVRALNLLSEATGTFIPLLPFILEVLQMTDFNKKHASSSFKPLNFAVMLRLSNSQLKERAFKDGVIDQVYDLLVEHLQVHSHRIGFPELALPVILELRSFLKKCKVANFTRQMKQLLDKVLENCQEVTRRREKVTFGLADDKAVRAWEMKNKEQGTPILKFYQTYKKLRERELKHEEAGKERLIDDKIPTISQSKKRKLESKMELKDLFKKDVGSDDEEDLFKRVERKQTRMKEKRSRKGGKDDDDDDNDDDGLESLDEDELAALSEGSRDSTDEDDDEDEDEDDDDEEEEEDGGSHPTSRKTVGKGGKSYEMEQSLGDADEREDVVEDFKMWSDEEEEEEKPKKAKRRKTVGAQKKQLKSKKAMKAPVSKQSRPNGEAKGKKKKQVKT
ncbi:nucleolar complex protein 2 homolog [Diadema antillarum]|uniref:nucleolar complex protein 2 homolog n=1 Tax=Diadema antillarum TaxID=105358 RepID=UPI003A88B736